MSVANSPGTPMHYDPSYNDTPPTPLTQQQTSDFQNVFEPAVQKEDAILLGQFHP